MEREKRLLKNTMIIGIGVACTRGISFLLLPLYTALLSTSEYGTIDLVTILVTLITYTLTLQFDQGIFRFLIESRGNKVETKKYISTTIITVTISLIIGLLFTAIICFSFKYKYLLFLLINISSCLYCSIFSQIARGLGKTVTYTVSSFISAVSQILFNILFIVGLKWHIGGMLTATIIAQLLSCGFCFISCRLWELFNIGSYDKKTLKKLMSFSLPMIPSTLCWWIISLSDRIFINYFLGIGVNGIYAVANKFPSIYATVTDIFQKSWAENAAENSNKTDSNIYYSKIMNQSVIFLISSCMIIVSSISIFFNYFININYNSAYIHIMILLVAAFFHSWANLYASLFTAIKKTKNIAKTTIYAAITNLIINIIFISKIGLFAASISTLISYIVILIISHKEINKTIMIKYNNKTILILLMLLIICSFAYYINNLIINCLMLGLFIIVFWVYNHNIIDFILKKSIKKKTKVSS